MDSTETGTPRSEYLRADSLANSQNQALQTNLEAIEAAVSGALPDTEDKREESVDRLGSYLLREPAEYRIEKTTGQIYRCSLPAFPDLGAGEGETRQESLGQLERHIHFLFQRLARLNAYERSQAEQQTWEQLVRLIDVEQYNDSNRVLLREVGQIVKLPADAGDPEASSGDVNWRVLWETEEQEVPLSLGQVPLEFARLSPGQWFEALLSRNPHTGAVQKIVHAEVCCPPRRMSEEDLDHFLDEHRHENAIPLEPEPEAQEKT